jgi:hypothetical protein
LAKRRAIVSPDLQLQLMAVSALSFIYHKRLTMHELNAACHADLLATP